MTGWGLTGSGLAGGCARPVTPQITNACAITPTTNANMVAPCPSGAAGTIVRPLPHLVVRRPAQRGVPARTDHSVAAATGHPVHCA